MKTLRWLLFIPVAAILAIACSFGIASLMPFRSYSQEHLFLSLISPRGLAPYILERFIPVALFVVIGAMLAPTQGRKVIVTLGLLGGVFGWPFGPQYSLEGGSVFYAAASFGTLVGCAVGLLLAFQWQTKRRKEEPIQLPEPTSGLAPGRGSSQSFGKNMALGTRRQRIQPIVFSIVGLALLVAGLWLYRESDPKTKHRRVLARFERWFHTGLTQQPADPEARGIYEVKRALWTASGNWPLWYPENAPTQKLALVADYLDRTHGSDFNSYAGALHVEALLEEVSPTLHDYPWIAQLREMQADGTIPPPPHESTSPAQKTKR